MISLFSSVICFANEKDEYEKGIKTFTIVIEKGTTDHKMYEGRAFYEYMLGKYNEAYADTSEALKLNPESADAYKIRGMIDIAREDTGSALNNLNKAIRLNPNDPESYLNRGIVRKATKDLEGSLKDFDIAIKADPNNAFAYCQRGHAKLLLKDKKGAYKDYSKAVELDPNNKQYKQFRDFAKN